MSEKIKSGLLAALLKAKVHAYVIWSRDPEIQGKLETVRNILEKAIEIVEEITERVEGRT